MKNKTKKHALITDSSIGNGASAEHKAFIILLFALGVLAVLIRTVAFGKVPGGMNQDGAMAAVDAAALAKYGTDRLGMRFPVHLTAWGFGQMSALMSYLMIPFIKIFGLSVTTARLPSLLISLLGLAALYGFARKGFGKEYAVVLLFLTAINPWHIMQSRWALDCNLFPHFLLFGMYFLLAGVRRKKWLYLSAVLFGLSMYCYGIALYTVPVFLLAAFVYLYCKKAVTIGSGVLFAAIYLLVAWPFMLCMAINFFGWETVETPLFTVPYFPDTIRSGDILFFSEHPFIQLLNNARCLLRIIFQFPDGTLCNEVTGFETMYIFAVPFILTGMVSLFRRFCRSTASGLICLWFLTGIWAGLITANVNINRLNLIFYPLLFFTGAGFLAVVRLAKEWKLLSGRICRCCLGLLFLSGFILFSKSYFTTYADQISESFMQDFGEAMTDVKEIDAGHFYITPDAQYEGFWYVSEVLTLFYHDIDAKYYQSEAFNAKYHFKNPDDTALKKDAVYVTTEKYSDVFSPEDFVVTHYGRFLTAVPVSLSGSAAAQGY